MYSRSICECDRMFAQNHVRHISAFDKKYHLFWNTGIGQNFCVLILYKISIKNILRNMAKSPKNVHYIWKRRIFIWVFFIKPFNRFKEKEGYRIIDLISFCSLGNSLGNSVGNDTSECCRNLKASDAWSSGKTQMYNPNTHFCCDNGNIVDDFSQCHWKY